MLLSPDVLGRVSPIVSPEHFYSDANTRIFEAILALSDAGRSIDILTLRGWLEDRKCLQRVGGPSYLVEILDAVPAVSNVEDYAIRIAQKHALRQAVSVGKQLAAEAYSSIDATTLLRQAIRDLERVADANNISGLGHMSDATNMATERAKMRKKGDLIPVPICHSDRAEALGGGYWEGLHLLISGTGAGKSQFVIEDILHAAKAGVPCLYIGLELDAEQVAIRFIAEESKTSWSDLYLGKASNKSFEKAERAVPFINSLPIYTEYSRPRDWPVSRLEPALMRLRQRHPTGPALVVLDYLQIVAPEPDERRSDIRDHVGAAAYMCRALAVKYQCAIVAVSSTARSNYVELSGNAVKTAGIKVIPGNVNHGVRRIVAVPDALVGAGKESGEIEAAADSVTVLVKWPSLSDQGNRIVLVVTAKGRATGASWCALEHVWGTRFVPYPVTAMDDLPAIKGKEPSSKLDTAEDYEARVLETVRDNPGLRSKKDIETNTKGRAVAIRSAVETLLARGTLLATTSGFVIVPSS